jgi:hypothetical protein
MLFLGVLACSDFILLINGLNNYFYKVIEFKSYPLSQFYASELSLKFAFLNFYKHK